MPAPRQRPKNGASGDGSELLRMLGKKAEGRGLDFELLAYPDGESADSRVEQIVVTNERMPERGEVRVSDDGTVTWEFFRALDDAGCARILDEMTNALRAPCLPKRRPGQS
jgi:hypothetical protein